MSRPAVAFLASDEAPTGIIMTAAAGVFAAAQLVETDGVNLGHKATADDVADHFKEIADFDDRQALLPGRRAEREILREDSGSTNRRVRSGAAPPREHVRWVHSDSVWTRERRTPRAQASGRASGRASVRWGVVE